MDGFSFEIMYVPTLPTHVPTRPIYLPTLRPTYILMFQDASHHDFSENEEIFQAN